VETLLKKSCRTIFAQSTIWDLLSQPKVMGAWMQLIFLLRDALQVTTTLQNTKQGSYSIDPTRSAMCNELKLPS
jgi:hypothetical protein